MYLCELCKCVFMVEILIIKKKMENNLYICNLKIKKWMGNFI